MQPEIVVLIVSLLLSQAQPAADLKLSVRFSMEPQPSTFLGFYDTLFSASFAVNVTNIGKLEFPGGKLEVHVEPPSGKYIVPITISIPRLMPKKSFVERYTFQPQESGVYTIMVPLQWLEMPNGRIPASDIIEGGFLVQDFKGPEIVYTILGLVIAILGLYGYKSRRK